MNGEDVYLDLVRQHLSPDSDVLDIACGHGEVPLAIAPLCRRVLAYDRVAAFIELARAAAREKNIKNGCASRPFFVDECCSMSGAVGRSVCIG